MVSVLSLSFGLSLHINISLVSLSNVEMLLQAWQTDDRGLSGVALRVGLDLAKIECSDRFDGLYLPSIPPLLERSGSR